MGYKVILKRQARKKLLSLSSAEKVRIAEKIHHLGENPDDNTLDIKKLVGQPYYRLRVGNWRILFEREDLLKIISIEMIKPRGDAYK